MKLTFDDPLRPQDNFVIYARTDGDPEVANGETFEVSDEDGRALLAAHAPRLKQAAFTAPAPAQPDNPIVVVADKADEEK